MHQPGHNIVAANMLALHKHVHNMTRNKTASVVHTSGKATHTPRPSPSLRQGRNEDLPAVVAL